ncbi:YDG/SRA domain-containing protein [Actinoplanes solisilvae]|uniref:YDG/SRA domain-containing protein n=1 Tax=Actinoplanes solisilvae TaxID=2486853 RepID=UPI001F0C618C|nr:YDG/SRA domain-containing protein [Actinoplanes solisilvae]
MILFMARVFGEIDNVPVGSTFVNRRELYDARVHRELQAGICGGQDGAESIVVSGGYADDEDNGDEIIYTGQGGQDPNTRKQVKDQTLTKGNVGLARSKLEGYLVRVVRGAGGDEVFSPSKGLRYDGLYRVADFWHEPGIDGPRVWRFRLVIDKEASSPPEVNGFEDPGPVGRRSVTTQRPVRSLAVAQRVKRLHDYTCQICRTRITTPAGGYAEAAHIRGLGEPHNGTDVESNVLCLCPNHHVMLDTGAIYVDPDWTVWDTATGNVVGTLQRIARHRVDPQQLAYHKAHYAP